MVINTFLTLHAKYWLVYLCWDIWHPRNQDVILFWDCFSEWHVSCWIQTVTLDRQLPSDFSSSQLFYSCGEVISSPGLFLCFWQRVLMRISLCTQPGTSAEPQRKWIFKKIIPGNLSTFSLSLMYIMSNENDLTCIYPMNTSISPDARVIMI